MRRRLGSSAVATALRAVSRLTQTRLQTERNKLARGGLRNDVKPTRCEVALTGVAGRGSCYGFAYSIADLESSPAGFPSSPRRFSNGSM